MARPLRIEYPGAFYHITARGNERKDIFRNDADRQRFLGYLETAVLRYKAVIHVYCMMDNHYHLLLQTPDGNLSQIMRHINGGYTTWFNKRHERVGHLFQGRYRAILVDADEYAGELSRYIHLNPVRAGIVERPEQHPWSSYSGYLGKRGAPSWLTTDWLLGYFGSKPADARRSYRSFVESSIGEEAEDPLREAISGLILGRTSFVEEIQDRYFNLKEKKRDLPALKELRKVSIQVIVEAVQKEFQDKPELAKKAALYICHRYSGRPLREIGGHFDLGESGVSQASRRFEASMTTLRLEQKVKRALKELGLCNV